MEKADQSKAQAHERPNRLFSGLHFRGKHPHLKREGDEERARLVAYVEKNPVKARLCQRPEDWKWSSAGNRVAGDSTT